MQDPLVPSYDFNGVAFTFGSKGLVGMTDLHVVSISDPATHGLYQELSRLGIKFGDWRDRVLGLLDNGTHLFLTQ